MSFQSILAKIYASKLNEDYLKVLKEEFWTILKSHQSKKLTINQSHEFQKLALEKLDLFIEGARTYYMNEVKNLEKNNPTLLEESYYLQEVIDQAWEYNIENNGFEDWTMDKIGHYIDQWDVPYEGSEDEDDNHLPTWETNDPLHDKIRNLYIDQITLALKTCYI